MPLGPGLELYICECNCGGYAKPGNRFIFDHQNKGKKSYIRTNEIKEKNRTTSLGNKNCLGHKHTPQHRENNRQAQLALGKSSPIKGKTNEEFYGTEKAKILRDQNKLWNNKPENIEKARERANKLHEEGKFGWEKRKESNPEKYYRKHLESLGYTKNIDFFQEVQIGLYRLDFTFKDKMIDFEIDGKQHQTMEAIKHDRIRDKYLKNLGWIIMRRTAKTLHRLLLKK
mgnify:FL=1